MAAPPQLVEEAEALMLLEAVWEVHFVYLLEAEAEGAGHVPNSHSYHLCLAEEGAEGVLLEA